MVRRRTAALFLATVIGVFTLINLTATTVPTPPQPPPPPPAPTPPPFARPPPRDDRRLEDALRCRAQQRKSSWRDNYRALDEEELLAPLEWPRVRCNHSAPYPVARERECSAVSVHVDDHGRVCSEYAL